MKTHCFSRGGDFSGRERRAIALGAWGNPEMPPMQFGNRERMQGMQNMPQMNPYLQQRPRSNMDVRQMYGGFQNRIGGMQQQSFYPQFQGGMPQMPMMNNFMRGMRSPMAGAYLPRAMGSRYGGMQWPSRLRQYPQAYRGSFNGQHGLGPMGAPGMQQGAGFEQMQGMEPYSLQLMQQRLEALQAQRDQLRMELQMLGEWDRADADPVVYRRSATRDRVGQTMGWDRDSDTGDLIADWHRLGPAAYRASRMRIKTAPYRTSVPDMQYRAHLGSLSRGGAHIQEGAQSSFVRNRGGDSYGVFSDNPIAQRHIEMMGGDRYLQTQNRLRNMYARDLQGWVDRNLSLYADDPAYPSLARAYDHARQMRPGDYGDLAIMRSQILAMRQRDERSKAQDRLRSEFANAKKLEINPAGGLSFSPEERIVFSIPPGTPGYSGRSELRIAYKPFTELGVENNEEWDLLRRLGIFIDKEKSGTDMYMTGDMNRPRVTRVNVYFKDPAMGKHVKIYQPGYRETMPMPIFADGRGTAKPVWPPEKNGDSSDGFDQKFDQQFDIWGRNRINGNG